MQRKTSRGVAPGVTTSIFGLVPEVHADEDGVVGTQVATGQRVTPAAAPGSAVLRLHTDLRNDTNADAADAVTTSLSPDGSTLLILTCGSNNSSYKDDGAPILWDILDPTTTGQTTANAERVFVYDLSGPVPLHKQITLPVTHNGLIRDKSGTRFYVSRGATSTGILLENNGTANRSRSTLNLTTRRGVSLSDNAGGSFAITNRGMVDPILQFRLQSCGCRETLEATTSTSITLTKPIAEERLSTLLPRPPRTTPSSKQATHSLLNRTSSTPTET